MYRYSILLFCGFCICVLANINQQADLIERISDIKEFKKLLRTKTNTLVFFSSGEDIPSVKSWLSVLKDAATRAYGRAAIAHISCSSEEGRKLCKKLKASPSPFELKHYSDGEFNKDFDRQQNVESVLRFLDDPKGDQPWEEDPMATDVVHVSDTKMFHKLIRKESKPILMMFYAPWCGHCKRLKPEYSAAAMELKASGSGILAAMDVNKPENNEIRNRFNITGFPTLLYFQAFSPITAIAILNYGGEAMTYSFPNFKSNEETNNDLRSWNGDVKFQYGGENTKDGLVKWMKDPHPPKAPEAEQSWADEPGEVVHLTDDSFKTTIAEHPSVLVMFYAPWCGHCKHMKPIYSEVANELKAANVPGLMAAVDATVHRKLATDYDIKGFPTVKYFKDGKFAWDYNERDKQKIIDFMKNPVEPPPPPEPEKPWNEVKSEVLHLSSETFKNELKKRKHVLVMFYAPWCGHCKAAKPHFAAAAEKFKGDSKVAFAAIDCTDGSNADICTQNEVTGYPTLKYFTYFKTSQPYFGGREEKDFVSFMNQQSGSGAEAFDPPNPQPPATKPPSVDEPNIFLNSAVHELTGNSFKETLAHVNRALVMFYAPWCTHCKKAKPDFLEAAKSLGDDKSRMLAAVDCTLHGDLCKTENVEGYPTFKIYKSGTFEEKFAGARTKEGFLGAIAASKKVEL